MTSLRRALLAWTWALVCCGQPPTELPPPPAELGLDPFYRKYVDSGGLPIVSSEWVADEALHEAHRLTSKMLEKRPDIRSRLQDARAFIAIIAVNEHTTDIPEWRDLYREFPDVDWNHRARGLGGTHSRPMLANEENLLCLPEDRQPGGYSVFIHELAHTLHDLGLDETAMERIDTAYQKAMAAGRWQDTYAATDVFEFWAEGAVRWFDAVEPWNFVLTREDLQTYDPDLAALAQEVFPEDAWRHACPHGDGR